MENKREMKAMQIWQMQETISQTLRHRVRDEVKSAYNEILAEKLPGRQNDALVAVRHLCQERPEGIPLNQLALYLQVASPTASVMVDSLVEQGYLERYIAPEDRRAKRIRLSLKAEDIYMTGDKAILKVITCAAGGDSENFIDEWHGFLEKVSKRLELDGPAKTRPRGRRRTDI